MNKIIFIFITVIASNIFAQNQNKIDSLRKAISKCKEDTNKVKLLIKLSDKYNGDNVDEAIKNSQIALLISKKIKYNRGLGLAYNRLGKYNTEKGSFKQAIYYFNEDLKVSGAMKDETGIARGYDDLCIANFYLGNCDTALKQREKSLEIYKRLNNKKQISSSLLWIGNLKHSQSLYTEALEYYLKSLAISEEIKDSNLIAYATLSCASVYTQQKNYTKAMEFDLKGLKALKRGGDVRDIATTYNNMGNIYFYTKHYDESLKNCFKALELRNKIKDSMGIASSEYSIAINYYSLKKYNEALEYDKKALIIAKKTGDKLLIGGIYSSLGAISNDNNKPREAISYLLQGLEFSKSAGGKESMNDIYKSLGSIYEGQQDYKNALKYFKLYKEVDDSIKNQTMSKNILELQKKYETEKKDKEIALLNKDNIIEKTRYKFLSIAFVLIAMIGLICFIFYRIWMKYRTRQKINEFKLEALNAQLVDHFIGNTISTIYQLIETNENEKARECLLKFSDICRTVLTYSEKKLIPLKDDLEFLDKYIQIEKYRFKLNEGKLVCDVKIDEDIDIETTLFPPMIFQVLAENSINHGFKKRGEGQIIINIRKNKNEIECVVKDNGIGREAALKNMSSERAKVSKGGTIARKLIEIVNVKKFKFNVSDLYDDAKKPIGTLVEFAIPIRRN